METRPGAPICSLLPDDEESAGRLDAFVAGLGERIDALQDAERAGALDEAAKAALELAREARALGLPPLAEAATSAAAVCAQGARDPAHAALVELTDVVRRVRLGHRGGGL